MNLNIVAQSHPTSSQAGGAWQNIRWRPNPSTGEIFNIGVLFVSHDGSPHVRVLTNVDRIKCLYDNALSKEAEFLITVTREALLSKLEPPTDNVFLSEPKFASGNSVESILETLFQATVPLGIPKSETAPKYLTPSIAQNTDSVREAVLNQLKKISGINAGRIINSEQSMVVNDGKRTYALDVPLQTSTALGTIVSARYAKINDTELRLHRADTDLKIAQRIYRRDQLFMYVVRPEHGANIDRVDALLDEYNWKFSQMGVSMKSYAQPELVAPDIVEDMPLTN